MNPFNWIRSKVAQAVVDGFDDAMTEIGAQVETDAPLLRSRLSPVSSPALPAAPVQETETIRLNNGNEIVIPAGAADDKPHKANGSTRRKRA